MIRAAFAQALRLWREWRTVDERDILTQIEDRWLRS